MAVKIIVDSASDISKEEAERIGIKMISMEVTFGEETFLDGEELLPEEFYKRLATSEKPPITSLINSYRWEEEFKTLTQNGDEVIAIVISSKLSGTYQAALNAAKNFGEKVFVVDSYNAAIGERLLCNLALDLISKGKSAKEIAETLDNRKKDIRLFAVVDTLKYLKKGGRISATVAFAGELMGIKPLLQVEDGEVKIAGKVMGLKKAFALLNSKVEEVGGIDTSMPYGTIWAGNDKENLDKYISVSKDIFNGEENIPSYILGGTIGTHVGPGAIGLAFFAR